MLLPDGTTRGLTRGCAVTSRKGMAHCRASGHNERSFGGCQHPSGLSWIVQAWRMRREGWEYFLVRDWPLACTGSMGSFCAVPENGSVLVKQAGRSKETMKVT
jgi:hypothetical protein